MAGTTDVALVKADAVAQIRQITPSYTPRSSVGWSYAGNLNDIGGAALRTFMIRFEPPSPSEDGWFGSGLEYTSAVDVITSYRDIVEDDLVSFIDRDGTDVWNTLRPRIDPTLSGVLGWEYLGSEILDIEEPFTATHLFEVRFKARTNV